MQSWQLFPIVIVVGVVFYTMSMRKKLGANAGALYTGAMDALRAALVPGPDESAAICVVGTERKLLSGKVYYLGVTNRRVAWQLVGAPAQVFDRNAVRFTMRAKTFADVGNMQTMYSRGWELVVELPEGKHVLRVYDQAHGLPDHPAAVGALAGLLGAA